MNKLGHPEPAQTSEPDPEPEDLPASSPVDHEFISDAFPDAAGLDAEDLKEEMQQLGMTEGKKDDNTDGKVGMTPSFMGELASLCL